MFVQKLAHQEMGDRDELDRLGKISACCRSLRGGKTQSGKQRLKVMLGDGQ
jgi:hypothetical protein